jgi:WD40 repeat protein
MGEQYKIYDRVVATQQRIYFDITQNGKYLLTGGTDGIVKIWNLSEEQTDNPVSFQASTDCVNGIRYVIHLTKMFRPLYIVFRGIFYFIITV